MYSDKVKKRTLLIVLLLVACIIVCLLVGQSIRAGGKNLQEDIRSLQEREDTELPA